MGSGAASPDDGYTIDLKLLDDTTERIAKFVKRLSDIMDEVDNDVVQRCAQVWGGIGSDAYQQRQATWARAMTRANGEVEEMRIAARRAHANYTSAKSTNLSMLGR
ncbi:WXG100 family type VII secretion target [Gordonia sp. ABSL11-1]|uniref:WXG100 family type VII secretion target n=1 Tax=Gordonia sp. ABSL11-1 TaxID=3053924 RepID=UPI002573F570|nr:WXG100 family type VII secretion target [Gordonia sp. ABSL11-1]MDL9944566.1 WXG100 family type VII secretion target [Gordonia sp. ABSL11-1]